MTELISTTISDLFSKPFRGVLIKSLGLTLLLLVGALIVIPSLAANTGWSPFDGSGAVFGILAGFVTFLLMGYLIVPITALFAGLFLDDIADVVEGQHYSHKPKGIPMPLSQSLWIAIKFMLIVIATNIVLIPFIFLGGLGFVLIYVVNGYLLGREYFELAALRHHTVADTKFLRSQNKGMIYGAGILVAFLATIPILNLFVPIFGTSLLVHVFHKAEDRQNALQA
ncbi:MAG: EI24 domain-containing protein [Rhizobiales bacterium]|nr:EI24 domain-containing protein [Hyphomicrobiales bacterium]